ncbi:MAG: isoprenylcysteine carboxylmethyltransferase family protein, partial [Desulfobacteraceae bacterium]|nr:isoprenylcysteine carboxylmethyltransferase family protein [Desulfobacteraceae bacterium]
MYLSFFMWAIGQALLIENWLAGPLGLFAFVLIYLFRVGREEQQLLDQFGIEYEKYQKKTGRLLPKLSEIKLSK